MRAALLGATALCLVSGAAVAGQVAGGGAIDPTARQTANNAVPQNGSSLPVNLGLSNGTGGSLTFWNGASGTHSFEGGSSSSNSAIYSQPYIYGHSSTGDLFHLWAADGTKDNSLQGFTLHNVYESLRAPAAGNHEASASTLIVNQTPETLTALEASLAQTQFQQPAPSPGGLGWPGSLSGNYGTVETGWDYNLVTAPGLGINYIHEFDSTYALNVGVVENVGIDIVDQSSGTNTAWGNGGHPGMAVNSAMVIQGDGWKYGLSFGRETGSYNPAPDMTLIAVVPRSFGGTQSPVVIRNGLDLRQATVTRHAFATKGMGVDGSGNVAANSLVTGGSVAAQSATLTGVTVTEPGTYSSMPTWTVQPPQLAGGTTATVTTTGMVARSILAFGGTGSGYKPNDVFSLAGVTGTSPTYTVNTVDANGAILTSTQTTAGSVTDYQSAGNGSNPVHAVTGGSGTGAMFFAAWNLQSDGRTLVPTSLLPAATGSGFKVNDTVTIAGDTGTAAVFTVNKVTAQGGILTPAGLTLTTAGSQTALASGTYHTATSSGSGTGASLQVGYGVATVSFTPGSGYLPLPAPLIIPSQTNNDPAEALAQMTPVAAGLGLNGIDALGQGVNGPVPLSGGNIYNNNTTALPTTCTVAPLTGPGGVAAQCHASMSTTLNINTPGSAGTGYAANTTYPVKDSLGDTIGTLTTGSVGSNGQIQPGYGVAPPASPFPLANGVIPAGPYKVVGGNNDATMQYANFAPTQAVIDDPGAGYGSAPVVTISAAQDVQSTATGTATTTATHRTAGNEWITGILTAMSGVFQNLTVTVSAAINALTVNGLTDNGNASVAGSLSVTGSATFGSLIARTSQPGSGLAAASITVPASGTAPTGASQINKHFNLVTACTSAAAGASGQPVQLPSGPAAGNSYDVAVANRSGSTCAIYPPSGGTIEANAANVPVTLANGADAVFRSQSGGAWYQ